MDRLISESFASIYYYLHPEHQEVISHQSIRILQMVQKKEQVTVSEIAEAFSISPNTASEHVKKLAQKGWLNKNRLEQDQRIVTITLTESGEKVVKANTELDPDKLKKALFLLSEKEKAEIERSFKRLSEAAEQCM